MEIQKERQPEKCQLTKRERNLKPLADNPGKIMMHKIGLKASNVNRPTPTHLFRVRRTKSHAVKPAAVLPKPLTKTQIFGELNK
jgi:hypothetical protein